MDEEILEVTSEEKEEVHNEEPEKKKEKVKKKKTDKELEELKNANSELKEKVLRITAEMQNMRRRYDLDISNMYKYDGFDIAEKLLPVLDNFERAISAKQEGLDKFLEGFTMIYENLINILKEKGIKEVDAYEKEFDPNFMNAIATDDLEEYENNIVTEVFQKGYIYNDKLLRPAMVKVNNKSDDSEK